LFQLRIALGDQEILHVSNLGDDGLSNSTVRGEEDFVLDVARELATADITGTVQARKRRKTMATKTRRLGIDIWRSVQEIAPGRAEYTD
jgi:hypothetical protein